MNQRLLLNLRHVPEDELEEVLALLDQHQVEHYLTPPGPFGISAGGLWIRDTAEVPRAKALFDEYQHQRAEAAYAQQKHDQRAGRQPSFWGSLRRHPIRVMVMIALSVMVLMIFFAPALQLFQLAS